MHLTVQSGLGPASQKPNSAALGPSPNPELPIHPLAHIDRPSPHRTNQHCKSPTTHLFVGQNHLIDPPPLSESTIPVHSKIKSPVPSHGCCCCKRWDRNNIPLSENKRVPSIRHHCGSVCLSNNTHGYAQASLSMTHRRCLKPRICRISI